MHSLSLYMHSLYICKGVLVAIDPGLTFMEMFLDTVTLPSQV